MHLQMHLCYSNMYPSFYVSDKIQNREIKLLLFAPTFMLTCAVHHSNKQAHENSQSELVAFIRQHHNAPPTRPS